MRLTLYNMKLPRGLSALVVLGFLELSALAGAGKDLKEREWTVGNVSRTALMHVPLNKVPASLPVVFAFHGHGGSSAQAARSLAIHQYWQEAIVVYPQGLKTPGKLTDPQGRRAGWQHDVGEQDDRDLKFFDAVLATLKEEHQVDESRIYSTGHSNGAAFTYVLWAARHQTLAAVAPSAAVPGKKGPQLKPLPALHVAGETDALVKYSWQYLAMEHVRKLNGCNADKSPWKSAGTLKGTIYHSASNTPMVTLIHPGGHRYPEEASALIVEFFQTQQKSLHHNSTGPLGTGISDLKATEGSRSSN
jgi:polyhydroxybutyrate depolymerase